MLLLYSGLAQARPELTNHSYEDVQFPTDSTMDHNYYDYCIQLTYVEHLC